jgi:hypothetical protein
MDHVSVEMLESDVDEPVNVQDVKEMTSNRLVDCGAENTTPKIGEAN